MNRTETAAMLASYGIENEALLTDLAGPPEPDWEAYRWAVQASYDAAVFGSKCSTPMDPGDIHRPQRLIAAHPFMPETRVMQEQAAIDALELQSTKLRGALYTPVVHEAPTSIGPHYQMSRCDKCGWQCPTPVGALLHKCGACSGGYCHPIGQGDAT